MRHPSRLDRDFGRKRYCDEGYAREELVAELGAAVPCADLVLTPEPRPDHDHAACIASWLDALIPNLSLKSVLEDWCSLVGFWSLILTSP